MSEAIPADAVFAVARLYRLQWEPVQNAHVLLYPEGMVKLNQSAGEILKRLDGKANVAEVATDCESAFGAQALLEDIRAFLVLALEQGWVRRVS